MALRKVVKPIYAITCLAIIIGVVTGRLWPALIAAIFINAIVVVFAMAKSGR